MSNEKVSDKQGILLVVMFIIGISIIIIPGLSAGKDAWLAVLASVIITLPLVIMYARLRYISPNADLYSILHRIFGNFIGKLTVLLYVVFSLYSTAIIFRIIGDYIVQISLLQTPIVIPIILFALLCVLIVKQGIEVLARYSEIFFLITGISIIITFIILMSRANLDNIRPFLYDGFKPFIKGTYFLVIFPFTELFIFTAVFSSFKTRSSVYKIFTYGLLIGGIVGTIFTLYIILILGIDSAQHMYYPSYFMLRRIKILRIFQGIELIFAISYIVTGFLKVSIYALALSKGISRLFNFENYRFIVLPTTTVAINFALILYNNMIDVVNWYLNIWPYFATIFQIILPIIIYLFAEIKYNEAIKISPPL